MSLLRKPDRKCGWILGKSNARRGDETKGDRARRDNSAKSEDFVKNSHWTALS